MSDSLGSELGDGCTFGNNCEVTAGVASICLFFKKSGHTFSIAQTGGK